MYYAVCTTCNSKVSVTKLSREIKNENGFNFRFSSGRRFVVYWLLGNLFREKQKWCSVAAYLLYIFRHKIYDCNVGEIQNQRVQQWQTLNFCRYFFLNEMNYFPINSQNHLFSVENGAFYQLIGIPFIKVALFLECRKNEVKKNECCNFVETKCAINTISICC